MSEKFDIRKIDYISATDFFQNKNVVFTGKGFLVRGELWQIIRRCKGIVSNTVTSKTDILIVGDRPGSKLQRAKRNGCEIITIEDFKNILMGTKVGGIYEVKVKPEWLIIE